MKCEVESSQRLAPGWNPDESRLKVGTIPILWTYKLFLLLIAVWSDLVICSIGFIKFLMITKCHMNVLSSWLLWHLFKKANNFISWKWLKYTFKWSSWMGHYPRGRDKKWPVIALPFCPYVSLLAEAVSLRLIHPCSCRAPAVFSECGARGRYGVDHVAY